MTIDDHHHHDGHEIDPVEGGLFTAAFWDDRYGSRDALWSGNPNPQLVAEAAGLPPGEALDAGCGEGADAIWLAERGWHVTAVDISTVALERGAASALRAGAEVAERITWRQVDLLTWRPPPGTYDLVSSQFMQLPAAERADLCGRLAAAVTKGGTLLVVGHSLEDLETTVGRPHLPELMFTAGDVADALDSLEWRIAVREARPREGRDPDGNPVTVKDEVIAAVRV